MTFGVGPIPRQLLTRVNDVFGDQFSLTLWSSKSLHPGYVVVAASSTRTKPALSFSLSRYECPRILMVMAWCSTRSRIAVASTRFPNTSPQAPKLRTRYLALVLTCRRFRGQRHWER